MLGGGVSETFVSAVCAVVDRYARRDKGDFGEGMRTLKPLRPQ